MAYKIMGVTAGRKNSNSEILLKEALMACEELGAEVRMINLKDFHILDDGMDVDPNWYDLWVSARYEDGALYVDRLALRRIAPPSDGKKK